MYIVTYVCTYRHMEILIYKPNYICTYEHMLLYVHQFIFTYVHVNFVQWNQYGFKKVSIIPKRCFIYIRGVFEGPSLGGLHKNNSSKTQILVETLPLFSYLPALTLKFSLDNRQFYSYTVFNVNQHYCNFTQFWVAEDSCAATVNQLFNISILISEYCLYALCENFE